MTYSVSSNKKYFFKIENNLNGLFSKFTTYDLHVRSLFNNNDSLNQLGSDNRVLNDERNSNFYRSFVDDTLIKKKVFNYSFYQVLENKPGPTPTGLPYPNGYFKQQADEYSLIKIFNPKQKKINPKQTETSTNTNNIILSKRYPANSNLSTNTASINKQRQGSFLFQRANAAGPLTTEGQLLSFFTMNFSQAGNINQSLDISQKLISYINTFSIGFTGSTNQKTFDYTGTYLLLDTKSKDTNPISGLTSIQNNSLQNSLFCQNYYMNNTFNINFKNSLLVNSNNTNFEEPPQNSVIPKIVFYDEKSSISLNIDSRIDNNSISIGKGGGSNTRLTTKTSSPNISAGTEVQDTNAIFNLKSITDINIHNNQGGRIYDDHPASYSISNTRTFWEY